MRTFITLIPITGLAVLILGGCAYRDDGYRNHNRMGVSVSSGEHYNGYYDGSYGAFNDGYWGSDGAFYYVDGQRTWRRDDGNHFRRDMGDGDRWVRIRGSGAQRDH
jgi:hypothetical protein